MSLRTLKKRRMQCKTDYNLRLGLLKSEAPRMVIRRTNKYFIIQVVSSKNAQDKVTFGITSKSLIQYGWDNKLSGSLKSIPAGYLTGYLVAQKLKGGKFIIDLGMARSHSGGRLYSVITGLKDGGLDINSGDDISPSKEKIEGKNSKTELGKFLSIVKKNIETETEKKEKPIAKSKATKEKKE